MCRYAQFYAFISVIELPRIPAYRPKLNELSGQERCDWINAHNTSSKIFKENDWKNAGRPKRQVNMLPDDFLKKKLSELINDIKK